MPHYKNGEEAQLGDEIQCLTAYVPIRHGIVMAIWPGSDTCNLGIATVEKKQSGPAPALVIGAGVTTVTAKECEKLAPCVPGAKIEAGK